MSDPDEQYHRELGSYRFDVSRFFSKSLFNAITDIRIEKKEVVLRVARTRRRRPRLTADGKLTVLAADHPGRMCIGYGDDPIFLGDRHRYLGHVLRVLLGSEFDGVMGTPVPVLKEFEQGLKAGKNVRGVLVGRNILFPGRDDPACVAQAACRPGC